MFLLPKQLLLRGLLALGILVASVPVAEAALSLRITRGAMSTTITTPGNVLVVNSTTNFPGFGLTGTILAFTNVPGGATANVVVQPNLSATGAAPFTVEVTATDFVSPNALVNILESNAAGNIVNGGGSVTVQGFIDRSNAPFGMAHGSTGLIVLQGIGASGSSQSGAIPQGAVPFSLSVSNTIALGPTGGTTNFTASAILSPSITDIPEPASLFLWSGIASALGVSGLVVSRRRKHGPDGKDGVAAEPLPEADG